MDEFIHAFIFLEHVYQDSVGTRYKKGVWLLRQDFKMLILFKSFKGYKKIASTVQMKIKKKYLRIYINDPP